MTTVFYAFRDSHLRRSALAAAPGSPERYSLYGLDELRARGWTVRHNLESGSAPPRWAELAGRAAKRGLEVAGGYGGDFATVFSSLRAANRSDVVFSTVDTVGIPLVLLKRAGRLRPPLVYAAIGLPERLAQLRGARVRRLYAQALSVATIVAYSVSEAEALERWLEEHGRPKRVEFVPFGVDTDVLVPTRRPSAGVVSVGADPHRDFELLFAVAERMPEVPFRVVAAGDRVRTLGGAPANVEIEADLPFAEMRDRLESARVVALPVRENSYSGATTVLLQAMALGKPVVVTRTQAIATGYGLVDGENCRLVAPGDADSFERSLASVLGNDWHARALGASARATVERSLGWDRYVDRLEGLLRDAAAGLAPSGSAAG